MNKGRVLDYLVVWKMVADNVRYLLWRDSRYHDVGRLSPHVLRVYGASYGLVYGWCSVARVDTDSLPREVSQGLENMMNERAQIHNVLYPWRIVNLQGLSRIGFC